MFRRITLLIGLACVAFGLYDGYRTFHFIKSSISIDADVKGYSSFQKLERIPGECSASRKACEIELAFTMPNGDLITTAIPQPIFARTKGSVLSLLVDPADPTHPRIAALHFLFRNAMVTLFLGIVILFVRWLIGMKPIHERPRA